MLYNFPAAWTDRSVDVGGATDLSASDKQFIARLYPK